MLDRIDEELLGDGHSYSPKAVHSWLTRVMYNRRSKMNPLWNTVVIGGFYNGERWARLCVCSEGQQPIGCSLLIIDE